MSGALTSSASLDGTAQSTPPGRASMNRLVCLNVQPNFPAFGFVEKGDASIPILVISPLNRRIVGRLATFPALLPSTVCLFGKSVERVFLY